MNYFVPLIKNDSVQVTDGGVFILCNQRARLNKNHDLFFDSVKNLGLRLEEVIYCTLSTFYVLKEKKVELDRFMTTEQIPLEKTHLFLIYRQ